MFSFIKKNKKLVEYGEYPNCYYIKKEKGRCGQTHKFYITRLISIILHNKFNKETIELFNKLISVDGFDINYKTPDGCTVLHMLVFDKYYKWLDLLLQNGADINIQDNKGFTPIMVAVNRLNYNIFKCLLDKGADINITNKKGRDCMLHLISISVIGNSIHGSSLIMNEIINHKMKKQIENI